MPVTGLIPGLEGKASINDLQAGSPGDIPGVTLTVVGCLRFGTF